MRTPEEIYDEIYEEYFSETGYHDVSSDTVYSAIMEAYKSGKNELLNAFKAWDDSEISSSIPTIRLYPGGSGELQYFSNKRDRFITVNFEKIDQIIGWLKSYDNV